MAQPHGIDIRLLHQLYVLQHPLVAHHPRRQRVVLVAVGSSEPYRSAVYQYLAAAYLHASEAYFLLRETHAFAAIDKPQP